MLTSSRIPTGFPTGIAGRVPTFTRGAGLAHLHPWAEKSAVSRGQLDAHHSNPWEQGCCGCGQPGQLYPPSGPTLGVRAEVLGLPTPNFGGPSEPACSALPLSLWGWLQEASALGLYGPLIMAAPCDCPGRELTALSSS